MKARQGTGFPSFCWHCNAQLMRAPGKGRGLFYFHLVLGPDGCAHRIHDACLEQATLAGSKLIPDESQLKERDIVAQLVKRVIAKGGEVRKVKWIGRNNAPDTVVMLPDPCPGKGVFNNTWWVEVKNPTTIKTFPANAHERAQEREHIRMRNLGQRVVVIGTFQQIEELLA